jgi:peptide subunit release factor 1 (eRF1)
MSFIILCACCGAVIEDPEVPHFTLNITYPNPPPPMRTEYYWCDEECKAEWLDKVWG